MPNEGSRLHAAHLSCLPESELRKLIHALQDDEAIALLYDWSFWARSNQIPPPGNWRTWITLAGRGWGKTRVGAEWVRAAVMSGRYRRVALVARTSSDARDVMIEGESGLLAVFPPHEKPHWEPSKRRLTFVNGAIATTYSAEEPERLRGPQHDAAWCDELCAWKYPEDTWSNLQFGLRLGRNPQQVVTTTPRPTRLLKDLIARDSTVVTRGSTYENIANLARAFVEEVIKPYEGTRLGRQELHAEILEDVEGALWKRDWIERTRIRQVRSRDLQRIVIAIDPAVTATDRSDETGIIAVALGTDGRGYVLDDASGRLTADQWAHRAVGLLREWKADRIIGEANNGGDLIERMIRLVDQTAPYTKVNASRGKIARAEPVAALYEQGRISHVGTFAQLEDEMCSYTGRSGELSPNRMDALVWGLSELFIEKSHSTPRAIWL